MNVLGGLILFIYIVGSIEFKNIMFSYFIRVEFLIFNDFSLIVFFG